MQKHNFSSWYDFKIACKGGLHLFLRKIISKGNNKFDVTETVKKKIIPNIVSYSNYADQHEIPTFHPQFYIPSSEAVERAKILPAKRKR